MPRIIDLDKHSLVRDKSILRAEEHYNIQVDVIKRKYESQLLYYQKQKEASIKMANYRFSQKEKQAEKYNTTEEEEEQVESSEEYQEEYITPPDSFAVAHSSSSLHSAEETENLPDLPKTEIPSSLPEQEKQIELIETVETNTPSLSVQEIESLFNKKQNRRGVYSPNTKNPGGEGGIYPSPPLKSQRAMSQPPRTPNYSYSPYQPATKDRIPFTQMLRNYGFVG